MKNKLSKGVFVRRKRGKNLGLGKLIERVGKRWEVWYESDNVRLTPPSNLMFIEGKDL